MVNIKTLLPDLKRLVQDLDEDLLTRATEIADIDAGLREAFSQIEKGGRTAQAYEVWREDYLDQVAVAWVLACVFVRFMEDNHLIDECWLAGEGERRKLAEDTHELFFRAHPHDTDREYFQYVFHEVGKIPASKDLFAEGKTPLWAVAPSGDAAMKLLAFWREMQPETGQLMRSFEVKDGDTRFLGDLYQELSDKAKKKFALLQTPVFVEEFILDRTHEPAIDEFGLDTVRMIDPTCGSGHFLLGGFARLFRLWMQRESNTIVAAQKALDGVWGVDINPFAVAIARFRLIVAALLACGIKRLNKAPGWNIHLATGDSLLFGSRWNRSGEKVTEQGWLASDEGSWAPEIYACEDKNGLQEVLGQQYHAVVGNPPYIIVRDSRLNEAYRQRYPKVCHGKYSVAVPFTERFFDLALASENGRCGHVGMITANSFMKREFGKKLIEDFFPRIDLSHVVDTSGAYIPGHGTPTVILFGRNRSPNDDSVRAVLGIKGEPGTPDDPSQGLVWRSIVRQIDIAGAQDDYTSTADMPRMTFNSHPWSIGGGGATDLREMLEANAHSFLGSQIDSVGFMVITGCDEVLVSPTVVFERSALPHRDFITGEQLRDWHVRRDESVLFVYDNFLPDLPSLAEKRHQGFDKFLWPNRTVLRNRSMFGKTPEEHGFRWFEFIQFIRPRVISKKFLAYAVVSTHNQFVMGRGGQVYNPHAPIITLPNGASEEDYLGILGLLNSSTACFWIKQVMTDKGNGGIGGGIGDEHWERRFEFTATQMQRLPIPEQKPLSIARLLDQLGRDLSTSLPDAIVQRATPTLALLEEGKSTAAHLRGRMIALQEELDWECYRHYGLLAEPHESAVPQPPVGQPPSAVHVNVDVPVHTQVHAREGAAEGGCPTSRIGDLGPLDANVVQPPSAVPDRPKAKPSAQEYRRKLPHLQPEGKTLEVTFCTWHRWELPESVRGRVLRHCLHDHGVKLHMHAAVVMPDHVHLLFTPLTDSEGNTYGLAEIMSGIKGASAHSVNKMLGRKGPVWQDESFDHYLRSEERVEAKAEYICQNPVRKGLAASPDDYEWLWREGIEGREGQAPAGQSPLDDSSLATSSTTAEGGCSLFTTAEGGCSTSSSGVPQLELGERAFEIVMARQMAKGELQTTWFVRHGSTPVTELPGHWPDAYRKRVEQRIHLIETNKEIGLIEKPEYKRRWNTEPWQDQEQRALKSWLLDRLETTKFTKSHPELTTTAQMADVASGDHDFLQVAALYRGRPDFDVAALVNELVESESVPFLPVLRYKPSGLRKREVWERTWDLQRREDAGEKDVGDIPVPPKYTTTDFIKQDYWRLRGKLDVPKERWISYPHLQTESDPSLVVGWAGWNHLQQATALVAYYDARKREGWDAKRLTPILSGLDQLLPWIHQWNPEIDPEFGDTAGQSYQVMLENDAHELGLTLEEIRGWQPPAKVKGSKASVGTKRRRQAEDDA